MFFNILGAASAADNGDEAALLWIWVIHFFINTSLYVLAGLIYWVGMEASPAQGTLGKIALRIKVTDLDGNRIGFAKALGRYLGRMVSQYATAGLGYLMVAFTDKKQAVHDIMAGCLVVDK